MDEYKIVPRHPNCVLGTVKLHSNISELYMCMHVDLLCNIAHSPEGCRHVSPMFLRQPIFYGLCLMVPLGFFVDYKFGRGRVSLIECLPGFAVRSFNTVVDQCSTRAGLG